MAQIHTLYTADAYFKDPFNEVRGVDAIEHIFTHLFTQVDVPRFVVRDALREGEQVFVTWDFIFRMRRFRQRRAIDPRRQPFETRPGRQSMFPPRLLGRRRGTV